MSLLTPRAIYSPFEYPEAYKYCELQQQSHWLAHEINMSSDIQDWKTKLTDSEKNLVAFILKGFTQTEVFISEYWSNQVAKLIKKPEVQMMAITFASMESIHAQAYALLNQSLGLEDFEAFLHEPATKAKIDRLMITRGKSKTEIARSLAVFSAFNEGVSLFSSFAILLNFSRFNKLKGVGQIVSFSIKDETLHSTGGCWLFRTLIKEYKILTEELKQELYEAARLTVKLEDDFIDKAFEKGPVEGITAYDLKNYIRFRTNTKLGDITLDPIFNDLDEKALQRMNWFSSLSMGISHTDFFSSKETSYSKGVINLSKMWD